MTGSFPRAIRAELLKFFSTRLWWGMAIGVFLSGAAFALLFGILLTSDVSGQGGPGGIPSGDSVQVANSVYTAGLSVGYLLMLTIGVIQIGSEYRHRTITSTFLTVPRRGLAMLAKVVALLVIGIGYGVVSLIGSVSVGALTLNFRGEDAFPSDQVLRTIALSLLVLGLWALIGLGVGILIPNQVAALLIGVGVAWIVEPVAGLAVKASDFGREHVAPYFPTEATNGIVNAVQNSPDDVRLEWWAAALTLAVWAAVLSGVGIMLTVRRDVS
jgi:ABC-2 type transport system permease protein